MGPVIGAMFARWGQTQTENSDWFVMPALFAFSLALADIIFVVFFFRETLPSVSDVLLLSLKHNVSFIYINDRYIYPTTLPYFRPSPNLVHDQADAIVENIKFLQKIVSTRTLV